MVVQHDCIAFAAAIMRRSPESAVPTAPDYELSVLSECSMRLLLLSAFHLAHAPCPLPFAVWHCNLPCGTISGAPRRVYNGNLNNVPKYADIALFALPLSLPLPQSTSQSAVINARCLPPQIRSSVSKVCCIRRMRRRAQRQNMKDETQSSAK